MINALLADITKSKNVEVIVNAANGRGIMGSGVAGAIARAGGETVGKDAIKVCNDNKRSNGRNGFVEGESYISSSGTLSERGIQKIYHCVTMDYPGGRTSLDTVSKAMRSALDLAIKNGIKSIAFPALGTGVGGLNKSQVASIMVSIAKSYESQIDITLVDIDKEFMSHVNERIVEKVEES
jgi:O-acetyl-ADP-ribose deacetylase